MYEIRVDIFDCETGRIISYRKLFFTLKFYNKYFDKLIKASLYNPVRFRFGWIGRELKGGIYNANA